MVNNIIFVLSVNNYVTHILFIFIIIEHKTYLWHG